MYTHWFGNQGEKKVSDSRDNKLRRGEKTDRQTDRQTDREREREREREDEGGEREREREKR